MINELHFLLQNFYFAQFKKQEGGGGILHRPEEKLKSDLQKLFLNTTTTKLICYGYYRTSIFFQYMKLHIDATYQEYEIQYISLNLIPSYRDQRIKQDSSILLPIGYSYTKLEQASAPYSIIKYKTGASCCIKKSQIHMIFNKHFAY